MKRATTTDPCGAHRRNGAVRLRRPAAALATALLLATAAACGGGGGGESAAAPASEADRQAIRQMLGQFLPALASAYGSGDLEALRPYAVERVLAYTQKRVSDLQGQGMVLQARFDDLVIEDLRTWGNDFAVATTLETWDLTYYATGGESVISDRPDTKSRVLYQLKKVDGQWRVFHREMKQELSG